MFGQKNFTALKSTTDGHSSRQVKQLSNNPKDLTELSYVDGEAGTYIGFGEATPIAVSGLAYFPSETLSAYQGQTVARIDVNLANAGANTVNSLKVCIWTDTTNHATNPAYEQTVSNVTDGWTEVLLTTPYTIGTDPIFIGYTVDGVGYILGTESTPNNEPNGYGDIIGDSNGYTHLSAYNFGDLGIKAWVGVIDPVEAEALSINTDEVVPVGETNISGTIKNKGTDAISSYDVTYSIDGTESTVYNVTGVNITPGETADFTHNIPADFAAGTHTLSITISNVNGGGETNLDNNTLTKEITAVENLRTVLLEQFTTENCPNCPPVLLKIEDLIDNNEHIIMMAHHAGYGTDFLTVPESQAHEEFFNGNAFAPAGMFDRHYNGLDNDEYEGPDPGPVFWDGEYNGKFYGQIKANERLRVPATLSVGIKGINDGGELTLAVSGEFFESTTHDVGVSLWITEDHINAQNQANGGANWVHRYSVRGAISERLGDPISTSTNAGDTYTAEYTYTLDGSWNADELYLVAFVNDMNASDVNDRTVLNAVQVKLSELEPLGIDENISEATSVKVYPNPAYDYVNISNAANSTIEIYTVLGQLVYTQTAAKDNVNINISEFKAGNYIIKINTNDVVTTKKLNIIR